VSDPLVRVATEAEVLEHVGAFLQLYREEAHYFERTAPWVARVGIDEIKRRVVDDAAMRRALHERFLYSQQFVQIDPWSERAERNVAAHEYVALEQVR
jgi:nitrite reductase (NADH) large subunit